MLLHSLVRRSLVTGASLIAFTGIAHADLKIVQKSSVDGPNLGALGGAGGAAVKPGDTSVSTYYKGNKTRVEDATGITITDSDAGTVTKLDLKKKTYSTIKMAELTKNAEGTASPFLDMIDMKIKAEVKPGGHEKLVAGKKTSDWIWTATIGMSMKGGDSGEGGEMASISIEGEQWTSEEITLPATTGKAPTTTAALPGLNGAGMGGMLGMMLKNPSMKSLTQKMAVIKGFPLLTSMKMSIKSPFAEAQGLDVSKPISMKSEAITLSEEELPASLFAVPEGFRKVPFEIPQIQLPGGLG